MKALVYYEINDNGSGHFQKCKQLLNKNADIFGSLLLSFIQLQEILFICVKFCSLMWNADFDRQLFCIKTYKPHSIPYYFATNLLYVNGKLNQIKKIRQFKSLQAVWGLISQIQ